MSAQVLRGAKIDPPAVKEGGQLGLDASQPEQSGSGARLELDEQVHVAVGPGRTREIRSEQGQPADAVLPTHAGKRLRVAWEFLHACLRIAAAAAHCTSFFTPAEHKSNAERLPLGGP